MKIAKIIMKAVTFSGTKRVKDNDKDKRVKDKIFIFKKNDCNAFQCNVRKETTFF